VLYCVLKKTQTPSQKREEDKKANTKQGVMFVYSFKPFLIVIKSDAS
jgi:hypothetical protein